MNCSLAGLVFQLKYTKSTFKPKITITFFMGKHIFKLKHTFVIENQTCSKLISREQLHIYGKQNYEVGTLYP